MISTVSDGSTSMVIVLPVRVRTKSCRLSDVGGSIVVGDSIRRQAAKQWSSSVGIVAFASWWVLMAVKVVKEKATPRANDVAHKPRAVRRTLATGRL